MAKAFINDTNLTDIADAIRAKLGVSTQYLPSEMAGAILSIPKRKVVDFNVSSITLNGAKANSLQYVKAYGKCEQNGTPTPTSPFDIVCNNGTLKVDANGNVYTQGNQETLQLGINMATCEHLLALPGYTDTQEILSGIVNRKIGIKVLDGSEIWVLASGANNIYYTPDIPNNAVGDGVPSCYSTHFIGEVTTVNGPSQRDESIKVGYSKYDYTAHRLFLKSNNFNGDTEVLKSWLTSQYNAGTPVIIVYPLATPTTESVAGQTLQVQDGDNILEITQSALSGLEVECEYFLQ